MLRRPSRGAAFVEIGRTGLVGYVDVTYVDAPSPGAYDYVVRAVISSFASADTAVVTISAGSYNP